MGKAYKDFETVNLVEENILSEWIYVWHYKDFVLF